MQMWIKISSLRKCPGRMLILVRPTCVYILILHSTLDNVHFIDIAHTVHLIGVQRHCKSDNKLRTQFIIKVSAISKNQY